MNVKWPVLLLGLLHALATCGSVFGWAALLPSLIEEGVYGERCGPWSMPNATMMANATATMATPMLATTTGVAVTPPAERCARSQSCPSQESALNGVFTAALVTVYVSQMPMGWLFDRIGPRYMSALASAGFCVGLLLLAFAESRSFDAFVPAFAVLGWFGPIIQYTSSHFANMFPGQRGMLVSLMPGMFTASTANFFLVALALSNGVTRRQAFVGYALWVGFLTALVVWLYPDRKYQLNEFPELTWSHWWRPTIKNALLGAPRAPPDAAPPPPADQPDAAAGGPPPRRAKRRQAKRRQPGKSQKGSPGGKKAGTAGIAAPKPVALVRRDGASASPASDRSVTDDRWHSHRSVQPLHGPLSDANRAHSRREPKGSALGHLLSREWWLMVSFHVVNTVRANYTAGAMTFHLASLGDCDRTYNTVWSVMLPLSVFAVFLTGWLIDRYGLAVAYTVVFVDSLLYGAFMLIPSLPAQLGLFLLFGPARPILFGTMFSYCAFTFGFQHFGTLAGAVNSLTGLTQPLALLMLEQKRADVGYLYPNIVALCSLVLTVPFLAWLWYRTIQATLTPLFSTTERNKF